MAAPAPADDARWLRLYGPETREDWRSFERDNRHWNAGGRIRLWLCSMTDCSGWVEPQCTIDLEHDKDTLFVNLVEAKVEAKIAELGLVGMFARAGAVYLRQEAELELKRRFALERDPSEGVSTKGRSDAPPE